MYNGSWEGKHLWGWQVNIPGFVSYKTCGFSINDVWFPGSATQLLCMKQAPQLQKLTHQNSESLHQDSNNNGVRTVNFATSKNLVVKGLMLLHWNIQEYTWASPDGKTHNQIDHILIERRWHLSILYVWSFRGADCDTDYYLVVAKVRKRLAVSQQAAQKYDVEI